MKHLARYTKFFLIGVYFGVVLIKAEVISWFRIQEMFHFHSIHMYGVLVTAIAVGAASVLIIRISGLQAAGGAAIDLTPKPFNRVGNVAGGFIFGFGWALTGACPGPLYALLGAGYAVIALVIASALLGVITYGVLRPRLPH
ncbi:MAG: YeeE/YedE family protein [Spirochaetes bacterium]|jgi:uncharacterized membrane protein YedE/YeeE|nr:YeeE/YedE family protein [Spirochaetota bacterium]